MRLSRLNKKAFSPCSIAILTLKFLQSIDQQTDQTGLNPNAQ
jgi:hypothetical protein